MRKFLKQKNVLKINGDEHLIYNFVEFSLVQSLSCVWHIPTPWTAVGQLSCPSPTPGAYSNSYPLSQWCFPTFSPSVIPFSSCILFSLAWGSFLMSQFIASCGQSIGTSASASVLPMNIQDWFPLGLIYLHW